jgi:hypothetical protein
MVEIIDMIERFSFNLGRTIECIARGDRNRGANIVADLEQAQWHLEREIRRIKQPHEVAVLSSQSSAKRLVGFRQEGFK